MAVLDEGTYALRELEPDLSEPAKNAVEALSLIDRIREVRQLLSIGGDRWISAARAQRMLLMESEDAVKAWVRVGFLRGRTRSNGRLEVVLDDVLGQREVHEGLTAIDNGKPITVQEALYLLRPNLYPPPPEYDDGESG